MSDVHELPPHPRQRKGHRTLSPLLLASAKTESERQLYRSRIEREQRPLRAGPGCLDSAPLDLSGFLPGYAERGALRFCRCVGRA
ncbi:hypothetical protein ABIF66_010159 [Bradyrhizobium japonicum]